MRRLSTMAVAVLSLLVVLLPARPASAHYDACTGFGEMQTSWGFGLPGLSLPVTANFWFSMNAGACVSGGFATATGVLWGWCGLASGWGVTNAGHQFTFNWTGTTWTMGSPLYLQQSTLPSPGIWNIPTGDDVGTGDVEEDPFDVGSCFNQTATRFLVNGTWVGTGLSHGPPPPTNDPPYAPSQLAPAAGHVFGTADTQRFTIQTSDPEGDSYQGRIRVTNTTTNLDVGTYFTERVASGQSASVTAVPPLPPGEYTWVADASDDLAPTTFGPASTSRSFTVDGPPPPPPVYPSDDCVGGTTYADGFVEGTYFKLLTKSPTAGTTWVCFRGEAGGVGLGGKVTFASPSTGVPGMPSVTDNGAACTSMSGNSLPPPHPTVSGSIGDPGDPSTYVPFTADVFASADRAAVCVSVGATGRQVIVPIPKTGTPPSVTFAQDGIDPHRPTPTDNPSPVSGSCQAAATGTKTEHANVVTPLETVWLHTWQESATKTHVCVRAQGTATNGGRFTVDTTGSGAPSPVTTTSTTDTTPCALRIAGVDTPTTVDVRRSTSLTDTSGVSFCVIVGATKVRVTVGATGSAGVPQTTWTPDP